VSNKAFNGFSKVNQSLERLLFSRLKENSYHYELLSMWPNTEATLAKVIVQVF